eukprot:4248458-Amphidinium_carterae.1
MLKAQPHSVRSEAAHQQQDHAPNPCNDPPHSDGLAAAVIALRAVTADLSNLVREVISSCPQVDLASLALWNKTRSTSSIPHILRHLTTSQGTS